MKKNKIIAINGESWCRPVTGIERLAFDTVKEMDNLVEMGKMELVVPKNAKNVPELKNIKIVSLDKDAVFFPKWTQIYFQRYVIKNHRLSLDFSNTCPYFSPGIEYIHDIYSYLHPEDFSSKRDKLIKIYSNAMFLRIAKKAKKIITVSEYTKKTIVDTFGTKPEKIAVVYSGIGEILNIKNDDAIFEKFPRLKSEEFYFTLGSLSVRKNLKWIASHAQKFPNELFAISGKPIPSVVSSELEILNHLPNVVMTGYLSDGEVKALMSKCKAFVLPSYFEGFGLPPLEALSCGSKIIVSNVTSLPEIYGSTAYYIDPDDPNVDFDDLLSKTVTPPDALLKKLTLKKSAERLYEAIKEFL